MLAEEPRIVAVTTKTYSGLRSSIPPILHVCSTSRAVGLKHYTPAFECEKFPQWQNWSTPELFNPLPQRVYFNFDRDTLYFPENWNEKVKGAWCCLSHFTQLVQQADLKRVKRVGLAVDARVCSLKTSSGSCHLANFAHWDALETLYVGCEDAKLGRDCQLCFAELESEDYEDFMQRYKRNPCWRCAPSLPRDAAKAVEYLRTTEPVLYHGYWEKPDSFLRKRELVSVKHL